MKLLYTVLCLLSCVYATAASPTVPASNLSFNIIEGSYLNIGWHAGNGARRIIIARAGSAVTAIPQNGIDYTDNATFGSGTAILPGQYVVYDNAFTSFYLTGLAPGTTYYFAVFEYNGTGVNTEYLTSSFLTGNCATAGAPSVQASNITFSAITGNTLTISCTKGDGARRLIVAREGAPVNALPVDLHSYGANNNFGTGATVGTGNYAVYGASGNSTVINNLKSGTTYYFDIYEYNGSGEPVYKFPAASANVTTRSIPTIPASNVTVTVTDGQTLALSWTPGNGERRIVVAKQGSQVTGTPVNGTDYASNNVFGSGGTLAPGEYLVYHDNGNGGYVYGLTPATTYYFKIFEYDGSGSNTLYLTSAFAAITAPTAATPTIQAKDMAGSSITPASINLAVTQGNGRGRMIIGRKGAPVNVVPQDLTTYTANSDFGNGQDIGNGNFVLGYTLTGGIIINNLQPNTTYHFAAFEYNGNAQPLYLAPAATTSFTTSGPLPVKLTGWKGSRKDNKVQLQWTTQTEVNSSHFIIERSTDGNSFSVVATINAKGDSQLPINYSWEDATPLPGKCYYRLKMVDKDGRFEYSPVLTITALNAATTIRLFNNPVREKLVANFTNAGSALYEWSIINTQGQRLSKGMITGGTLEVNTTMLAAGTYYLSIRSGDAIQQLPFIKQ